MTMPTDETKIAVISLNVENIKSDIQEIKQDIKALDGHYIGVIEYNERQKEIETRLIRLEKSSNFWRFASPTLAAVAGSVLTFLLIEYLKNV